jgi:hydrogenase expression/formation protein HypE
MKLRAVLFDFDDTLTVPGGLDYGAIRNEMGCPEEESILDFLDGIEGTQTRRLAEDVLDRHEMAGAARAVAAAGAEELVQWLISASFKTGILTRNTKAAVLRSLENFSAIGQSDFDPIITRDDDLRVKPAPDGVLHAASVFGVPPSELLVVGDYIYDIEAGNAAGAATAFLASRKDRTFVPPSSTFAIDRIGQVRDIMVAHG